VLFTAPLNLKKSFSRYYAPLDVILKLEGAKKKKEIPIKD